LEAGRFRARAWSHRYNNYFPHDEPHATLSSLASDRYLMLKEILGSVGADAFVEPPFYIDYGCNIRMGDAFYANFK